MSIFYEAKLIYFVLVAIKMVKNTLTSSTVLRVIVLSSVILAQHFLSTELASPLIVLLILAIMVIGKIQHSYLKLVWPLLVVLVIGLMGAYGHESRDILRDIAFALMPIVLIYLGYWIAGDRAMWPLILKVMAFFGVVLALNHLSLLAQNEELLTADSMEIRSQIGFGTSDLVVLAFVIGLFQKHYGINYLYPRLLLRVVVMPILLASIVLAFSRTELMVGVLLSSSLLGFFSRINSRLMPFIVIIVIGYIVLDVVTPANEEGTFRSKLLNSVEEITISDYSSMSDINKNWRGFEAHRALETYLSGDELQLIMGQGFGALVDLGLNMVLSNEDFNVIPIIHNGYLYIMLKTGVLGLVCYAFFYINLIRLAMPYNYSINTEQRFIARLLLGCVLSLIASMYVVGGMAQNHSIELVILLGYLFRRMRQPESNNSRLVIGRNS